MMLSPQSDSGVSCTSPVQPRSPADVAVVLDIVDAVVGTSQLTNALATTVDLTAIISDSGESIPVAPTTSHLSETKIVLTNSADNSVVSQCGKVAIPKLSSTRTSPHPEAKPEKVKQKTQEQKLRKKAQNRDAALRYRSKKKDELGGLFEEAKQLEEKNKTLKEQVQGLNKEIEYLKSLMLDVIKARLARTAASA